MLKAITWEQFSIFILVVTGAYYVYVFFRYYRAEIFGWLMREKGHATASHYSVKSGSGNKRDGEQGPQTAASQTPVYDGEIPQSNDERFDLLQRAIAVIRQVIAQGIENRLDRENLLDHIREVLQDYRRLRNTDYADAINNFLIRTCSMELSLELREYDIAALWK